jgi:hypothetical protein
MADQKVTSLTQAASILNSDITYVVTDPAGVPTSKRCSWTVILNSLALNTSSNARFGTLGVGVTPTTWLVECFHATTDRLIKWARGADSGELGIDIVGASKGIAVWYNAVQQATIFNQGLVLGTYVAAGNDPAAGGVICSGAIGCGINAATAQVHVVVAAAETEILRLESSTLNDDPNYFVTQGRNTTSDATVTTLQTIPITANKSYLIEARVVARYTGGAAGTPNDGAAYVRQALVTTKGGAVTITGLTSVLTAEDQPGWDCTLTVSGANILVRVTGAANNNVTWHSTTILQNVGS